MVESEAYSRDIPQKNAAGLRHPTVSVAVVGYNTDGAATNDTVNAEVSAATNIIFETFNGEKSDLKQMILNIVEFYLYLFCWYFI